jgi:hypothetical protein
MSAVEERPGWVPILIDGFIIDCLLSEQHTLDSDVPDFPVESGGTISDNIRPKPRIAAMECLITDTPLQPVFKFRKEGSIPTDDAYALLKSIRGDRRTVSIDTSLESLDSMALESLGIPRQAGRGDELRFTAVFKQIEIVVNRRGTRVAIPAAIAPKPYQVVLSKDTPIINEILTEATATFSGGRFDPSAADRLKKDLKGLRFKNTGQSVPSNAFGSGSQEPNVSPNFDPGVVPGL